MSIFSSSIGKKLVMSISGLFLILFLTLHMCLNFVSVFSPSAFEACCEFMSLPIVSIMVPVLAFGFIIHIIYAGILTVRNYKARGKQRYEVANKAQTDSWAARNMIILGIVVLVGIALHLCDFWYNMQFKEWTGQTPGDPNALLAKTFSSPWITLLYVLWFVVLWFHLTHGFWSAFQTLGWNNNIWMKRLKVIGIVVVTILMLGFTATACAGYARANGIIGTPAAIECCGGNECCTGDCEKHEGCTGNCEKHEGCTGDCEKHEGCTGDCEKHEGCTGSCGNSCEHAE